VIIPRGRSNLYADFPADRWAWFVRKKLELNTKSHFAKPHGPEPMYFAKQSIDQLAADLQAMPGKRDEVLGALLSRAYEVPRGQGICCTWRLAAA
jgi:hypothetical protein